MNWALALLTALGATERVIVRFHERAARQAIPQLKIDVIDTEDAVLSINRWRRSPMVEWVEVDQVAVPTLIPNDPWYPTRWQWHLPKIGMPDAWDATTGAGVTVAVLDSGVDTGHPELAGQIVSGWNVRNDTDDIEDLIGHGTRVSGTIASVTNNELFLASVAPGASIMPIVVADDWGFSSTSYLAEGLVWAADHGARVANMSFAYIDSPTLTTAAGYFRDAGGVVVMSSGNAPVIYPAPDDPNIIVVSATTMADGLASLSTTGEPIDISAPGVGLATLISDFYDDVGSSSGTSHSAAIVSGVAALVLSANPSLTAQEVEDVLEQSADDLGDVGWDPEFGFGRVNADRAVTLALASGEVPAVTPIGILAFGFLVLASAWRIQRRT